MFFFKIAWYENAPQSAFKIRLAFAVPVKYITVDKVAKPAKLLSLNIIGATLTIHTADWRTADQRPQAMLLK